MARIIVTPTQDPGIVLMDEDVLPVHLCDIHSAQQVIERITWAVNDAETVTDAEADLQRRQALPEREGHRLAS